MSITIREVAAGKDVRTFIRFPEKLYEKTWPQWVHPIYKMQRAYFDPRKNDAFNHSDVILYLAWQADKPVGRIMGIINHRLNESRSVAEARFASFDCVDDPGVAAALLSAVEDWARSRGARYLIGPIGFTNTDNQGILVEGHDRRGILGSWWHPSYTHKLIESRPGYGKEMDWIGYSIDLTRGWPQAYDKIASRILKRSSYKLVEFADKSDFDRWLKPVFALMNEAYMDIYGFSPLTDSEIEQMADQYIPLLDPRLIKIITCEDQVVGFSLGFPDFTLGIRKARGRLFPLGWIHILQARNRSTRLDMVLAAIKREHRGKGLDVLMTISTYKSALGAGLTHVDTHQEQETNTRIRGEVARLGGSEIRRFRIYRKNLG